MRAVWLYWYDCLICGRNRIDALHHVLSPSTRLYVPGEHNRSVLNACPIHNFKCHIDNEAYLHQDNVLRGILLRILEALSFLEYVPNELDRAFFRVYRPLFTESVPLVGLL